MTFEYKVPSEKAPGFLRRERVRLQYIAAASARVEEPAAYYNAMIDWLLVYVTVPADRDDARAALEEISQEQFDAMIDDINGNDGEVDPKASDAPETG